MKMLGYFRAAIVEKRKHNPSEITKSFSHALMTALQVRWFSCKDEFFLGFREPWGVASGTTLTSVPIPHVSGI